MGEGGGGRSSSKRERWRMSVGPHARREVLQTTTTGRCVLRGRMCECCRGVLSGRIESCRQQRWLVIAKRAPDFGKGQWRMTAARQQLSVMARSWRTCPVQ